MRVFPNITQPEPINTVSLLKIALLGESNAFSQNDVTDQDFGGGGKQEDLPSDGAIANAEFFPSTNVWTNYELNMNWSPDLASWGIEYRFAKLALEDDIVADSLRLLKYSQGGTNLAVNWKAPDGAHTVGYLLVTGYASGYRPDFLIWIQGLNDAVSDAYADAYEDNLRDWTTYIMAQVDPKFIVIVRASTLTIPSYSHRIPTIQAAQDVVSAENTRYILHTPDPSLELNADGIHYSPIGMDDLASGIFNTIKPYINSLSSIP